jgi:hypothetical protein
MVDVSRPVVPLVHGNETEHRRLLAESINEILFGRLNNVGSVTLTANQATTAVTDIKVGGASKIFLTPTTASAATEVGSGGIYISAVGDGTFTITHANNATTDRTFDYAIFG